METNKEKYFEKGEVSTILSTLAGGVLASVAIAPFGGLVPLFAASAAGAFGANRIARHIFQSQSKKDDRSIQPN